MMNIDTLVHLFGKGWVIKTGNGKLSRTACRTKYAATTR